MNGGFEIVFDDEKGEKRLHFENFEVCKPDLLRAFSKGFSDFLYRRKLKIADIARMFNLTHAAVSSWKNGKGFPDFIMLVRLFAAGMTLKEMFGENLALPFLENSLVDFPEIVENHVNSKIKDGGFATMKDLEDLKKIFLKGLLGVPFSPDK